MKDSAEKRHRDRRRQGATPLTLAGTAQAGRAAFGESSANLEGQARPRRRWSRRALGVLLFLAGGVVLWQAGEAWWDRRLFQPENPGRIRRNLDTAAAEALLAREPRLVILDVCSEGEYRWMHLPGARNLPPGSGDLAARLEGLDREVPYLVYCAAGFRSRQMFSRMKAMGFRELYNLDRGLYGWRAAGRDVESGSGEGG